MPAFHSKRKLTGPFGPQEDDPMLLTIDVGNTNMVFGLFEKDDLIGSFRLKTDADATSDEIGIMASEYFQRFGYDPMSLEGVVIASVVPHVMYSLTSAVIKYFGKQPVIVDEDVDPGIRYEGDERLGADRSTSMLAAMAKYGKPLIVLDFGTATTVDAVARDGMYLGGTIGTGLRVSMDALTKGTALLPRVELAMPDHVIGHNTVEQIQAGVVGSYVGGIEYLITRMTKEMGEENVCVVATGGLSRLIASNTDKIHVVDPQLVLDGIRLCYCKYLSEHPELS